MVRKIFLLVAADQITKLVLANRDFFILGLRIHEVNNYGLGFGLNLGSPVNVLLISFILVLFIWYWLTKSEKTNFAEQLALTLIIAGGISNLADRIFLGFVRDFFDFNLGFTLNLADLYVILGLLIIFFMKKSHGAQQLSG